MISFTSLTNCYRQLMKQFLIILIISLFCYSGNSQTVSQLYKTWMPIGSVNEKGDTSITDFQQILTFKKDSIKATFFGIEKDTLLSFSIRGDSIFFSEVEAKYSLHNDSILRLDIYSQTVVFKAIKEGNDRYSAQHLLSTLKGKEWEFVDDGSWERFFSFDYITREAKMLRRGIENVFSFDRFDIYNDEISQEFGFWGVKSINGQILLNLEAVYGSNDFRILHLEEIKNNEIVFKGWIRGVEEEITFRKVAKLDEGEIEIFNSNLTGAEWLLTKTQPIKNGFGSFSNSSEDYFQSIDTTLLIKKEDLQLNTISYHFAQDSTFTIFIDDRKAYSGTWSILLKGRVIKLEEKWHGEEDWDAQIKTDGRIHERFLVIKSLTENEFHFIREEKLYTGFGSYETGYIEQNYRKRR